MTDRLALPDVTIVVIDNVEVELARLALEATMAQVKPGAIHIWSDKWPVESIFFDVPVRLFPVGIESVLDMEEILWREVPLHLITSHMLMVQWDGWVLDGKQWQNDFLSYDYIGAPWPWYKDNRVGNGGFSLRSTRLMQELATLDIVGAEDSALCRFYRLPLERLGFKWAPEALASQFSVERHLMGQPTFGFHGAFNFPHVLTPDELVQRIAKATGYARSRMEWDQMLGVAHA